MFKYKKKMKKKTIFIIGGVALALGLGYFIWTKSKKNDLIDKKFDADFDADFEQPISPKLKFIRNTNVARYLSTLLNDSEQSKLRGWVNLIQNQKNEDSSKWTDSNGLEGEKSVIGHALYQMKKQGSCDSCWTQEVMFALQDA